jgi:UDP-glucose 4-epimerase
MNNTKSWLITGGCGFIGTALIKEILDHYPESRIRVLDNLSVGSRDDLASICDFVQINDAYSEGLDSPAATVQLLVGDIRDQDACLQACQNCDLVVHLAANTGVYPSVQDPHDDCQANVLGTLNMLEAARQKEVKGFIFASSGAPVGEVEPPVHEKLAPRPVSPYGASKLAGEGYCSAYFRTFGLKTAALRFGNVYGPGSTHKSSVVAKFIKQAINGESCTIYGNGNQTRDFIYIQDLVQAILKIADFAQQESMPTTSTILCPWGEIFQIATNKEHTVNEMAKMLSACLQEKGIEMHLEYGASQPGDIKRNYSDTSKAEQYLGWKCSIGLQEGLSLTANWFLQDCNHCLA